MGAVSAIGLSSCQETSEKGAAELAYKVEHLSDNNGTLSEEDYSTMIDYVGEYAKKAQEFVDMQINGENLSEAAAGMAKLNEEYPYVNVFRNCIRFTPSSSLSKENLEKVGEYAGYVEFTAPSGYTIQTMEPDDAGLIEQTPTDDNGVVVGAVDNEKVELKNDW